MVAIRKSDLGKLVDAYIPADIERTRELPEAMDFTELFKKHYWTCYYTYDLAGREKIVKGQGKITEVLTPTQIHAFLLAVEPGHNTGIFVSRLIMNSFYAGYDVFRLQGKVDRLCAYIDGPKVTILGDAGEFCGERSIYSNITVLGDAGFKTGRYSQGTVFDIKGSAGDRLGFRAYKSDFTVGDIQRGIDGTECIFRTDSRATADKLVKAVDDLTVFDIPSDNQVYLGGVRCR